MATIAPRVSPLGDIQSLLDIFKGKSQTTTTSEQVSPETANALVQQILQGQGGIAAINVGGKNAGLYDSTTQGLLTNDLVARTAAEVAARSTTKSSTTRVNPQLSPISTLGGLAASTALKAGAKKLGIKTPGDYLAEGLDTARLSLFPGSVTGVNSIGADAGLGGFATAPVDSAALTSLGFLDEAGGARTAGSSAAISNAGLGIGLGLGSLLGESGVSSAGLTAGGYAIGAGDTAFGLAGAAGAAEAGSAAAGVAEGAGLLGDLSFLDGIGGAAAAGEAGAAGLAGLGPVGLGIAGVGLAGQVLGIKEINNVVSGIGDAIGGVVKGVGDAVGWIVCTELYRQGRLPYKWYRWGAREFAKYDQRGKQGYYIWAVPAVRELRKNPISLTSKLLCSVFNSRAQYLAAKAGCTGAKKTVAGFMLTHGLYAFCWTLSRTIARKSVDWSVVYSKGN